MLWSTPFATRWSMSFKQISLVHCCVHLQGCMGLLLVNWVIPQQHRQQQLQVSGSTEPVVLYVQPYKLLIKNNNNNYKKKK